MAEVKNRNNQTASFVVRFSQKMFKDDAGDPQVQWRGKISHVQSDEHQNFTEFPDAMTFMQEKLSEVTIKATEDVSEEDQQGFLSKSFDFWKKAAMAPPKLIFDTIKNPKAQVANIQEQLSQAGEELGNKLEIDSWKVASKADISSIAESIAMIAAKVSQLEDKIDLIAKKKR